MSEILKFWEIIQRDTIVYVSLLNDKESLRLTRKEAATQNCLELSKTKKLKKKKPLLGLNHRSHTTARQIKFWTYNVRRNHKNIIEIKDMGETLVLHYEISTMEIIVHCRITWKIVNEAPSHSEAWNVPKDSYRTVNNHNKNYKSNQLLLFREIIALCCENYIYFVGKM